MNFKVYINGYLVGTVYAECYKSAERKAIALYGLEVEVEEK